MVLKKYNETRIDLNNSPMMKNLELSIKTFYTFFLREIYSIALKGYFYMDQRNRHLSIYPFFNVCYFNTPNFYTTFVKSCGTLRFTTRFPFHLVIHLFSYPIKYDDNE